MAYFSSHPALRPRHAKTTNDRIEETLAATVFVEPKNLSQQQLLLGMFEILPTMFDKKTHQLPAILQP